jgi:SAM-dependent methyltransferase
MPEPAYLSQTRAAYNAVALDYARLLHDALSENLWDRALLSAFAELVAADGGGPVADLGCGSGRLTGHLRSLGLVPLGIDLSSAMVEAAQQAHPDLPFLEGSITAVPLGDGVLAGALAWYSIIHIPSAELAPVFAEFHRVLRPAGHLLLAFQAGQGELVRRQQAYGHAVSLVNYRHSPARTVEQLQRAGLTVQAQLIRTPGKWETAEQAYLVVDKPR